MNELVQSFLDDRKRLSAEELQTLAATLEEQPAELAELRAHLAMSDLLSRRFDEKRAVFVAQVKDAAARESKTPFALPPQSGRSFVSRIIDQLGHPHAPGGGRATAWAFAILTVGVLLSSLWTFRSDPAPSQAVELEVLETAESLSADAPAGFASGACIALSELKMPAGFLRFRLKSGALVAVTGPAHIELLTPMYLRVHQGRVTADVGDEAKGFVVETSQTKVVDLGTRFGVNVSDNDHTDVVVFQGEVELYDRKVKQKQARLVEGEAVRVDARQQLSRIASVTVGTRDEGWHTSVIDDQVITSVRDNLRDPMARNYYRITPGGLQEDARAFVGQRHEWNGLASEGLPDWLKGADLVQTFVNDRFKTSIDITVTVARPAVLYVLIDSRSPAPAWLTESFTDTGARIGMENAPTLDSGRPVAKGPGAGNLAPFAVWKREVPKLGTVTLGPPRQSADQHLLWMYGIAAKPL